MFKKIFFMFLLLHFLLVLKHPHTNVMHFSICNIQYFLREDYRYHSRLRGTLSGGADSDTVDSDWVLRFYIFMHVFKMFFIKVKKHVFIVFFICKLIFNIYDFTQMSLISCKTRCGCDWNA